jgi:hypothetical protein
MLINYWTEVKYVNGFFCAMGNRDRAGTVMVKKREREIVNLELGILSF